MAVGVKPGAVIDKGGNQMFAQEVNPSTFAFLTLTVGTYLFNLSYIGSSDFNQTADETETEYEDGDKISIGWTYTIMLTAQLKQSDKDLIDYLAHTTKGKTYLMGKYEGYINALHQWIYSIMKIKPQFSTKRPGGAESMSLEAKATKLNTSITYAAADMTSIGTLLSLSNYPTVSVTITSSQRFAVYEV